MELTIKLDLSDRTHSVLSVFAAALANQTAPQMQAAKPAAVRQTPKTQKQTKTTEKPKPTPAPAQQVPPVQQVPVTPTAPQPTQMPTANPVPTAPAPTYTLDQLGNAGAALASAGKVQEAMTLLKQFNVQSIQELDPKQYGAFATALRGLGAPI